MLFPIGGHLEPVFEIFASKYIGDTTWPAPPPFLSPGESVKIHLPLLVDIESCHTAYAVQYTDSMPNIKHARTSAKLSLTDQRGSYASLFGSIQITEIQWTELWYCSNSVVDSCNNVPTELKRVGHVPHGKPTRTTSKCVLLHLITIEGFSSKTY